MKVQKARLDYVHNQLVFKVPKKGLASTNRPMIRKRADSLEMTTLKSYKATEKWGKKGTMGLKKTDRSPHSHSKRNRISKLYQKLCTVEEESSKNVR